MSLRYRVDTATELLIPTVSLYKWIHRPMQTIIVIARTIQPGKKRMIQPTNLRVASNPFSRTHCNVGFHALFTSLCDWQWWLKFLSQTHTQLSQSPKMIDSNTSKMLHSTRPQQSFNRQTQQNQRNVRSYQPQVLALTRCCRWRRTCLQTCAWLRGPRRG